MQTAAPAPPGPLAPSGRPPADPGGAPPRPTTSVTERVAGWLARHSIDLLRLSLGLVFLLFGVLKFVPGVSPAEDLAVRTVQALTWEALSDQAALLLTASVETFVALALLTGRLLRTGLVVLAGALVGILAPLVLFFGELFPGAPTLTAQYVLKDIVLVAATLVVAAGALGARLQAPGRTRSRNSPAADD